MSFAPATWHGLSASAPSIRRRLNALVLSTALPAAFFAACALAAGYWAASRAVESSLAGAAASLSGAVDSRLLRLSTGLQTFALADAVDPARLPALRARALAFQRAVDAVNIVVVREDGVQLLNTLVPEGRALPHEPPSPFRAQVIAQQKPVIRDLFRGPVTGTWLSAIGVPAHSATRERYVIGASLTPGQILELLGAQHLPPDWVAAVLDSQGVIVARTPDNRFVGQLAMPGLRDALARQPQGVGPQTSMGGVALVSAWQRSSATGWSVVIGMPRSALWQPAVATLGWMGVAALLALLGSLALARTLGGRIAASMTALSQRARSVGGAGLQPQPLPPLAFAEATEVAEVLADSDRKLKAALSASEGSRARLRAIFDTAVDAVIVLDARQRIEVSNPAAAGMFGYDVAQLEGQPLSLLVPGWEAGTDPGRMEWQPAVLGGQRSSGERFPLHASVSRGLADGAAFMTVILRDITEEERTRQELLRSNLDLQRFASSASHDMRSPLRTLQGFLSVLADAPEMPVARRDELLQRCLRAVRQLDHLTGALLAFARLNAEPAALEAVDLAEVARDVLELLQPAIEESAATVQLGPLPVVQGVRGELVQLLQNLLANALQYRRPGVAPRVELGAVPVAGGWQLTVADNGIGIAPAYHEKVFGIFQRLHSQQEHAGSGIGLATCARIAARHGGRIWVESQEGQGARFHVILHAAVEESGPFLPPMPRLP